jgi:hypothetical protein
VLHPQPSSNQVDGAENTKQPQDQKDPMEETGQPKAAAVRADDTNPEQETIARSTPERQTIEDTDNDDDKAETKDGVSDGANAKQEERNHDDHGGEELVEGQEDDVIY